MDAWSEEALHDDLRIKIRIDRLLFDSKTGHQRLMLFESGTFGRVLTLDSVVQTTESDEFIYHEMMAHPPILAHGNARRVLIIGGGDGGMAEEVLKHESVERVTMVEIDPGVVEFSKHYLPEICKGAFDDARLNLVIADGARFVAETDERFDVAIIDSTDPIGPAEVLFTEAFYGNVKRCLSDGGIIATQNGVPFLQSEELASTLAAFRRLFRDATCYLATVPTYVGGPMAFGWGSDDETLRDVSEDELSRRFVASRIETRYYTPAVHRAAFALPPYIQDMIR
ncbi:MAG: polyamine aminopropyltransferase [Alphaproteobacteria bacterium]|nr:polyamine aminopropyltransferase [Alphaproteobacteria bacterium]